MGEYFKTSFVMLGKNPHLVLILVIYLIIAINLAPYMAYYALNRGYAFFIPAGLFALLTAVFFSGWLGMVKTIVNQKNAKGEEAVARYSLFKKEFFGSIPSFMFSLIFYMLLTFLIGSALLYCADKLFGSPIGILSQMSDVSNNQEAFSNFISTIPKPTLIMIFKRSVFIYISFIVYSLLTIWWLPSQYFQNNKNPFIGLKEGVLSFIKHPATTIYVFLNLIFIHIFLIFIEAVAVVSLPVAFIALVLRVYFIAYAVVLIFNVYEEKFKNNSNNGRNSLGQNETVN